MYTSTHIPVDYRFHYIPIALHSDDCTSIDLIQPPNNYIKFKETVLTLYDSVMYHTIFLPVRKPVFQSNRGPPSLD